MSETFFNRVALIGIGLIGSSLARVLRRDSPATTIVACARRAETLAAVRRLEQHGLRFSGLSPDGVLPEIVEYEDHPWFIGVQFHPELKSRPFEPHPLFASFIQAAMAQSRLV